MPYRNVVSDGAIESSNALNAWKLNTFNNIDEIISFYFNTFVFLPPKPKFTFRHMKKRVQDSHRKFKIAHWDNTAINAVVLGRMYLIIILKQGLGSA